MPPSDPDNSISRVFDPSERGAFSSGSRHRAQEPPGEPAALCFCAGSAPCLDRRSVPKATDCLGNKIWFVVASDAFFKQAANNLPSAFKVQEIKLVSSIRCLIWISVTWWEGGYWNCFLYQKSRIFYLRSHMWEHHKDMASKAASLNHVFILYK